MMMKVHNPSPIASKPLSNTMSYNIYQVEHGIEEKVLSGLSGQKPRWRKLYQSAKGVYFIASGTRYYLNDFMRTL